ncbi:MAG: DUF2288 domain-containing protein [Chromatium okenii]|nr:DUF2288 domain-containing protein [Chromatium okenii]
MCCLMTLPDELPAGILPVDFDEETELRQTLNQQTAQLTWRELQRFFAQGRVIWVRSGLDLIEIALLIARDDADRIASVMTAQQVLPVPDEQAQHWFTSDAQLWAVVVKPWVLVQDVDD